MNIAYNGLCAMSAQYLTLVSNFSFLCSTSRFDETIPTEMNMHELECNGRELITIDRRQARSLEYFDKAKKECWEFQLLWIQPYIWRIETTRYNSTEPDPGWNGLIWMLMRGNLISLTCIVSRYEKESITTLKTKKEKKKKWQSGFSLDAFLLVVTCGVFRGPEAVRSHSSKNMPNALTFSLGIEQGQLELSSLNCHLYLSSAIISSKPSPVNRIEQN